VQIPLISITCDFGEKSAARAADSMAEANSGEKASRTAPHRLQVRTMIKSSSVASPPLPSPCAHGCDIITLPAIVREAKMEWIKRRFQYEEYTPYMEKLGELQMQNPALYQEFMMVAVKRRRSGVEDEYYVGVPDKRFLVWFDGFMPVNESELPKEIDAVLLADQTKKAFTTRFRFRDSSSL
jgi:hypothetical protein